MDNERTSIYGLKKKTSMDVNKADQTGHELQTNQNKKSVWSFEQLKSAEVHVSLKRQITDNPEGLLTFHYIVQLLLMPNIVNKIYNDFQSK